MTTKTTPKPKKQKRVNYLNNRDILKEIHKSKMSFNWYQDRAEDNQQDIIVESRDEITPELIADAKLFRAARLNKELENVSYKAEDFTDQDIVIRVMTTEHIPLGPKKRTKASTKPKKKKASDLIDDLDLEGESEILSEENIANLTQEELKEYAEQNDIEIVPIRCNFPAFKHFRLDENNELVEVGRSHWKGDLETGSFNKTHGNVTDKLAKMYMKLCERYGTRSNWRGYTYNDEMRSQALLQLCQIGLQFNEAKSANPFAYYTAAITNSFTRVLNIEKKMQSIRDDILEANGLNPSWTRQFENDNVDKKYQG